MSAAPSVRRTDKAIAESDARAFLEHGYCGRLATVGTDGYPYCVPLLYVMIDGEIWLHNTAARGHLYASVAHEARVCFEIDEPGAAFPYGRFECDTSIAYRSVIAFGRIRIIADAALKQRFFAMLMAKYGDPAWQRPQGFFPRLNQTTVYAMTIERLTGKATALPEPAQRWPATDRSMSPGAVAPRR
jgi:nitroimidazol reductase NimA-like FMN-containing flavoprotein (pyridoxamine 5'-phosphate oxidase superfamily)